MKLERTHVITFANQKGGCGKTTSTVNIAAAAAAQGYSVCVIDVDQQCNTTDNFGITRDSTEPTYTIADAFLNRKPAIDMTVGFGDRFEERLVVIPGNRGLGAVKRKLDLEREAYVAENDFSDLDGDDLKNQQRLRLKNSIDTLRGHYDLVLLDSPPDLDFLMTTSLIASDWYIIPVFASEYDLSGLEKLTRAAEKVRERYNENLSLLGVLFGRYEHTKLDADILKALTKQFGERFMLPCIHKTVRLREATVFYKAIVEFAPNDAASQRVTAVANEMIARIEPAAEVVVAPIEHAATTASIPNSLPVKSEVVNA